MTLCAPRSGLELTPSGQCYCQLVPAVSQPLYPFGNAGIIYTTNDTSTLLNLFWQYFNVKVNVLHIELSEKRNCCGMYNHMLTFGRLVRFCLTFEDVAF